MKLVRRPNAKPSLGERLDNFIGIFSPGLQLRRATARTAVSALGGNAYQGSTRDRPREGWIGTAGSADQDLLPELAALRERSRDLNRNDGTASGITQAVVNHVVGKGLRPQVRVDAELLGITPEQALAWQDAAERVWDRWLPTADAAGRMSFTAIQRLALRQMLECGESFVSLASVSRSEEPWRTRSFAVELIEADRVDTPYGLADAQKTRAGVEVGERGQPLAYWIEVGHPGDYSYGRPGNRKFRRVASRDAMGRRQLLHLYEVLRPGQTRGVPFFAPVLTDMQDYRRFSEAFVMRARIAACIALLVKKNDPYAGMVGNATSTDTNGKRIEELEPGMFEYLQPGEDVTPIMPPDAGNTFGPFTERCLRKIGAAFGIPYEIVAADFSKTTYSSGRMALVQSWRLFAIYQQMLAEQLCQPLLERVLEEAWLDGELPLVDFARRRDLWSAAQWIGPGMGWVSPKEDVLAAREAIAGGLSTLAEECAVRGRDWEDVQMQQAREKARREELGLGDPNPPAAKQEPPQTDEREERPTEEQPEPMETTDGQG